MDELNLFRRRRLPIVLGAEAAECGLCCMAMIARYWGHDVDLNALRQRFPVSMAGVTLRSIMGMAHQLGFGARPLRVELEGLRQVALPAILHWDLDHFVVLKSISKKFAIVHDPAWGSRKVPMEALSQHFTGVVLELTPAATFDKQTNRAVTKLSSLWSEHQGFKRAFVQVLALSAALQVLTFAAPFQLQLVVDEAIFRFDENLLTVLALGFGALVVIQTLIEALRSWTLRYFGALLSYQMVGNLVRHALSLPTEFFEKRHVGDILSRMNSTTPIRDAITQGIVAALIDGVMAIAAGVILFLYSPTLALIVVGAVALSFLAAWAVYRPLRDRSEEEIYASAIERSHLMESIRASTTIKIMGREPERESAWRNLYAKVINAGFSVGKYQIGLEFTQTLITGLQTALVIYLAARSIIAGDGFSVGMLFAFLSFRQTFTDRANALIKQGMQFQLLSLHLERLGDIVHAEAEPIGAVAPAFEVTGAVRMRDVRFRYGAGGNYVLDGVNLEVRPGEFVGITGVSGGGKSTLLKVLLGLYAPTSGALEVDGRQGASAEMRVWRAQTGVVAQDDRLLSGTLADNIAFFDPDLDMRRIESAAKAARIHDEIVRMPMQYLSLVGDMGSTLSGGQRQRVLLARALYREPKVLLLDEGTANLDEASELMIAGLIAGLPITRIVIAHRPALLALADRVLVLKDGALHAREPHRPSVAAGK
ncbi:MAG: peptidase domain-containing ABC transporter [Hyphomonadaceae bacterium]